METPVSKEKKGPRKSTVFKEFLLGLIAIALGVYNILANFGIISTSVTVPQLIGNIVLVLTGLILWVTAYKLARHKYHTSRLF